MEVGCGPSETIVSVKFAAVGTKPLDTCTEKDQVTGQSEFTVWPRLTAHHYLVTVIHRSEPHTQLAVCVQCHGHTLAFHDFDVLQGRISFFEWRTLSHVHCSFFQMAQQCNETFSQQLKSIVLPHCVGTGRCAISPLCGFTEGEHICSLGEHWPQFPDPCDGKIKYFKVVVECGPRLDNGSPPQILRLVCAWLFCLPWSSQRNLLH